MIACLANGQPAAAEFLAARGAHLDLEAVAGIGRVDLLKAFFHSDGSLKPPATKKQLQAGFLWACMYGHEGVMEFLLEHGADLLDAANSGATALHWAAGGAHVNVLQLLLDHGAPLEEINRWGGTVLEHAGWGFEHSALGTDFVPTFETLLAAGAKIRGRWLASIEKLMNRSERRRQLSPRYFGVTALPPDCTYPPSPIIRSIAQGTQRTGRDLGLFRATAAPVQSQPRSQLYLAFAGAGITPYFCVAYPTSSPTMLPGRMIAK